MKTFIPMTHQALELHGRTLYGPQWKSPLARALGLTYTHLQRYMTGAYAIPIRTDLAVRWLRDNPRYAEPLGLRPGAGPASPSPPRFERPGDTGSRRPPSPGSSDEH